MKTRCIRDDTYCRWKGEEREILEAKPSLLLLLRGKPVGTRPILCDAGFGVENDGHA